MKKFNGLCTNKNIYLIDSELNEYSYEELDLQIRQYQLLLDTIPQNQKICLIGNYNHQSIAFLLACLINNHTVFPQISTLNLGKCQCNYVVSIEDDRLKLTKLLEDSQSNLSSASEGKLEGQIGFFTSGTSGSPKLIVKNFNYLWEKSSELKGIERALLYLKFDHLGGINTLFAILKSGKTAIAPSSRIPQVILDLITKCDIELLPTTPSFLDYVINTDQIEKLNESKLKIISFGAEPMSERSVNILSSKLKKIKLIQSYGLTEIKVFKTKSLRTNPLFIKIIDEDIQTKVENGLLQIKLLNNDWFNTHDHVESKCVEGEIFFRILGRSTDLINIGGEIFLPQEVEDVLLHIPEVIISKAFSYQHEILGNLLYAELTVTKNFKMNQVELKEHCLNFLPLMKTPVKFKIIVLNDELPTKKNRT